MSGLNKLDSYIIQGPRALWGIKDELISLFVSYKDYVVHENIATGLNIICQLAWKNLQGASTLAYFVTMTLVEIVLKTFFSSRVKRQNKLVYFQTSPTLENKAGAYLSQASFKCTSR